MFHWIHQVDVDFCKYNLDHVHDLEGLHHDNNTESKQQALLQALI